MHAPVGDQAEQVNAFACGQGTSEDVVFRKASAFDRVVDQGQRLRDDGPRAQRQMPDLGVSHLARRQAHARATGLKLSVRAARPELVKNGRLRQRDCIAWTGRRDAPAVHYDQARTPDVRELGSRWEGHWRVDLDRAASRRTRCSAAAISRRVRSITSVETEIASIPARTSSSAYSG